MIVVFRAASSGAWPPLTLRDAPRPKGSRFAPFTVLKIQASFRYETASAAAILHCVSLSRVSRPREVLSSMFCRHVQLFRTEYAGQGNPDPESRTVPGILSQSSILATQILQIPSLPLRQTRGECRIATFVPAEASQVAKRLLLPSRNSDVLLLSVLAESLSRYRVSTYTKVVLCGLCLSEAWHTNRFDLTLNRPAQGPMYIWISVSAS